MVIEQTRFLTVFLCSEFNLEKIYSGVNFCGKNVCGNFYLRELIFADRWKNRKNFVPHGILVYHAAQFWLVTLGSPWGGALCDKTAARRLERYWTIAKTTEYGHLLN